ncbi:MAG: hypothetical protein GX981_06875 [Tissierellia bacterium]|nr:hypothetical protein [Tissierellia bacterium]
MKNPRTRDEILKQTKKIEENNYNNSEYLNSINMMLVSNDLGINKNEYLSGKFENLNDKIKDINLLIEELLIDLGRGN